MSKTLRHTFRMDKEKFVVPKGVQDALPIKAVYEDGVFQVGKGKYSKTFRFEDINYALASREEKESILLNYADLLNSLDSGATTKITILNRRLNQTAFENSILLAPKEDGLAQYRDEYNGMLRSKASGANSLI